MIWRVHRGLLCLLLAGSAVWFGYAAWLTHQPLLVVETLLGVCALGLAGSGSRLTRYPVIVLALLLSAEWLTSVALSVRIGYFTHLRASAVVQALWPAVLMELVALYAVVNAIAFCPGHRAPASDRGA